MKRIIHLLGIVLLVVSVVHGAEQFTVVYINAWSGLTYDGFFTSGEFEAPGTRDFRLELIFRDLAELSPDFLGISEANPLPRFDREASEFLGMNSVSHVSRAGVRVGPVGLPGNLREGDIILSKGDLELIDRRQLSGGSAGTLVSFQFGPATQIIAARLEAAERDVYAFVVQWTESYFGDEESLKNLVEAYSDGKTGGDVLIERIESAVNGRETRITEATTTLDFINQVAGAAPVILMGSLHALPESPEVSILTDGGFNDAFASIRRRSIYTWDEKQNTNITKYQKPVGTPRQERIDYIFVRGTGIRVSDARIVLDRPTFGVFPSDHYGIAAIIEIDPEP
jgi:hypothetical protein